MQSTLRKTLPTELDIEQFVADTLARNKALFGDTRMDADDDGQDDDSSDGDDDGQDDDSSDGDDDGQDDDSNDGDDDKKLGEAGQKALDRMKARSKADRKTIRDLRAELQGLKAKKPDTKSDDDKADPEEIRRQARAEADAEILATRVQDKIEARTNGRFNIDPEDVAALILRRSKTEDFLDSDGAIDVDEIDEALEQLLKAKPALGSGKGSRRFNGDADSGRRKQNKPRAKSLTEALDARLSK